MIMQLLHTAAYRHRVTQSCAESIKELLYEATGYWFVSGHVRGKTLMVVHTALRTLGAV